MGFYALTKQERVGLVLKMQDKMLKACHSESYRDMIAYFSDEDTYIRKSAYLGIGRIYLSNPSLHRKIIAILNTLLASDDFRIRQTCINTAGEIGKFDFETVRSFFDIGLFDAHHSVRNAVIGSVKKMGEVNPQPILEWAKTYLNHENKEIRREICHGIELRGRKHPEDILPLLKTLQFDPTKRVRNTLVHVIGQIAYKQGCLEKVVSELQTWENTTLVTDALKEIVDVHQRYRNFSVKTQAEAISYISLYYPDIISAKP